MICPNCKYEHEQRISDDGYRIPGSEGAFYELPVMMSRPETNRYYKQEITLVGCPKCHSVFLNH
jgi:Zn finger protein HypA/HybF involved in hydrogenase expression